MQALQPGRFGDYYLTAHLGRGGMADVFRARQIGAAGFQRTVVVKRILNAHTDDGEFVRMFINEAKLAAELTHPNIAQIYDLGEVGGELFIAMEYVRGKDLQYVMNYLGRQSLPMPPAVAAFVAREVCRALAHAHGHTGENGVPKPIIHRDVSLSNIVISYDGQVKLVDFGIAKALHASFDATHTNGEFMKGKLSYMAPEQADGYAVPQSDLFSTGVVLHEMLTVRRLFKGRNPLETLAKLKRMAVPPPSRLMPSIPEALDMITLRALDRDLAVRYAEAAIMAKDLDLFLQAQRFSAEDLSRFMTETFSADIHTDVSQSGGPVTRTGSSARKASLASYVSAELASPVGRPIDDEIEVSIQSSLALDPRGAGAQPTPWPLTAQKVVAGLLLALVALGAYLLVARYHAAGTPVATAAGIPPDSELPAPPSAPAQRTQAPPPAPASLPVQGVTDDEILLGMAAGLSGPAKEYGRQMKLGMEAAFQSVNEAGGIHGRRLRLVTVDDGYDPTRTAAAMKELADDQKVFGFVGNTGTPTAAVSVPIALERKMLFFGAFTGASLLRRDPPDRYVFNVRASYAEEMAAIVKYLIKVRHIRPEHIAVFAQKDPFGDAGYAGITKAMRNLRPDVRSIFRVGYERNSLDVNEAVEQLRERDLPVQAIVMLALYRPAAKLIERMRDLNPKLIFISGSYVDSSAFAEELKMLGSRYTDGVVVTQVVPPADSSSTAVLDYRAALSRYAGLEKPDCISLEGFLTASVLIEGLRRAGRRLDTDGLVTALEEIRAFDLGIGAPINYGRGEHQGSHKIWGTQLDAAGSYQPIDLE